MSHQIYILFWLSNQVNKFGYLTPIKCAGLTKHNSRLVRIEDIYILYVEEKHSVNINLLNSLCILNQTIFLHIPVCANGISTDDIFCHQT